MSAPDIVAPMKKVARYVRCSGAAILTRKAYSLIILKFHFYRILWN
ncbi:hypothetical protein EMIT0196P_60073 [Pseudomonas chlororaphis]